MKTAVVDDMQSEALLLEGFLKEYSVKTGHDMDITFFSGGESFLEAFEKEDFDLIFMDIYMNGISGVEVSKKLWESGRKYVLVFLTSSSEHMSDAFACHAFDYLLKPVTYERLERVMNDITRSASTENIRLTNGREEFVLPCSSFVCAYSADHYIILPPPARGGASGPPPRREPPQAAGVRRPAQTNKKEHQPPMELIPFAEKDLDAFLAMCRNMYNSPAVAHSVGPEVFTATFRACLAGNQNVEGRMIVEDGCTLGYLLLAHSFSGEIGAPIEMIDELYLLPEARGHHIGRAILEALSAYYRDKAGALKLECTPENQVAMRLYQSLGFRPLPYTAMVWELPTT